ncbi:hypothetical protein BGZ47_004375 [Haplosporangium gracile]|nr:hypothetical protein BGZ47_004375 [Haplosporangium gracile]
MCGADSQVHRIFSPTSREGDPLAVRASSSAPRAVNVVTNNITYEDNTKPINYRPVNSTSNQEDTIMSEVEEEEEEEEDALLHANVSPDENVLSEHGF